TPGQIEGVREVGRRLFDPVNAVRTFAHRDKKATACPGSRVYARMAEMQPPFHPIVEVALLPEEEEVSYTVRPKSHNNVFEMPSGRPVFDWKGKGDADEVFDHAGLLRALVFRNWGLSVEEAEQAGLLEKRS